jgi:hypothetical protein
MRERYWTAPERIGVDQAAERFDRPRAIASLSEHPLEREQRLDVAGIAIGKAPQHAFRRSEVAPSTVNLGEQMARFEVLRIGGPRLLEPARSRIELLRARPDPDDPLARLASRRPIASREFEHSPPPHLGIFVATGTLEPVRQPAHCVERLRRAPNRVLVRLHRLIHSIVIGEDAPQGPVRDHAIAGHVQDPSPRRDRTLAVTGREALRAERDDMDRIGGIEPSQAIEFRFGAREFAPVGPQPCEALVERRLARTPRDVLEHRNRLGAAAHLVEQRRQLHHPTRLVGRLPDERTVLGRELFEASRAGQHLRDPEPKLEVARPHSESSVVGFERWLVAPELVVHPPKQRRVFEVTSPVPLEPHPKLFETAGASERFEQELIRLRAQARRSSRSDERPIDRGDRLVMATGGELRPRPLHQDPRERPPITPQRVSRPLIFGDRRVDLAVLEKRPRELGAQVHAASSPHRELVVPAPRLLEVTAVEREDGQLAEHVLTRGARAHSLEPFEQPRSRPIGIAGLTRQAGECQPRQRVGGADRRGLLVTRPRLVEATATSREVAEDHPGRERRGIREPLGEARLESIRATVALAV